MYEDDDIPPLLPPDQMPPMRAPKDVYRFWRALLGRLGFAGRALWFAMLAEDGELATMPTTIEELPIEPDRQLVDNLIHICQEVLGSMDEDRGSVAFLLTRPGSATMSPSDLRWAHRLLESARRAGLRMQPVHLATDEAMRVFAADDLVTSKGA